MDPPSQESREQATIWFESYHDSKQTNCDPYLWRSGLNVHLTNGFSRECLTWSGQDHANHGVSKDPYPLFLALCDLTHPWWYRQERQWKGGCSLARYRPPLLCGNRDCSLGRLRSSLREPRWEICQFRQWCDNWWIRAQSFPLGPSPNWYPEARKECGASFSSPCTTKQRVVSCDKPSLTLAGRMVVSWWAACQELKNVTTHSLLPRL